jgi:hypothetical protein
MLYGLKLGFRYRDILEKDVKQLLIPFSFEGVCRSWRMFGEQPSGHSTATQEM